MEKYQEVLDILDDEIHFLIEIIIRLTKAQKERLILKLPFAIYVGLHTLNSLTSINAKKWFKKALEIDGRMGLFNSLKFDEQLEYEEAYFIKMDYISVLKKYDHVTEIQEARTELENKFRLSNNADILLSHADELYTQCRFKECLEVTTNYIFIVKDLFLNILILKKDCLNLICTTKRVFLFTFKTSTMDSHCGPAWVGFGHTLAIESEHGQAITAYSTAAKLYSGLHLPTLFIGIQHLQTKNLLSTEEFLLTNSQICESDPLVLNELGVLYFQKLKYAQSVDSFKNALKVAEETKCRPQLILAMRSGSLASWITLNHISKK
ncbi:ApcC hetero-tetramer Cut9-Hcn1 [Gigaspora margarita]|uniref:ApcC hetero-tetramer Cut9-Hcn1 n=1 Tax=Gigaspora margarita TaxID=4874 RepID=A0A8H3XNE7_GIGMA|nr:ApcC hetero-tetramer Cut9-Hcn1 [Gigaspora margarita]